MSQSPAIASQRVGLEKVISIESETLPVRSLQRDIQLAKMKCLSRSAVPSWHHPYRGNHACAAEHGEYDEDEVEGMHDAAAAVVRVALIEGSTQRIKQYTYEGRGARGAQH